MKLEFNTDEVKDWTYHCFGGGILKIFIDESENLLSFLFFLLCGILSQLLAFVFSPISFIIVLLMAIKIKRT